MFSSTQLRNFQHYITHTPKHMWGSIRQTLLARMMLSALMAGLASMASSAKSTCASSNERAFDASGENENASMSKSGRVWSR